MKKPARNVAKKSKPKSIGNAGMQTLKDTKGEKPVPPAPYVKAILEDLQNDFFSPEDNDSRQQWIHFLDLLSLPPPKNPVVGNARTELLKHWAGIITPIKTLTEAGTPEERHLIWTAVYHLASKMSFAAAHEDEYAGRTLAALATAFAVDIVEWAKNPPSWLAEWITHEYQTAWLMVNGKPAPGYPNRILTKQGKSQILSSPATRAVAHAIAEIEVRRGYLNQVDPAKLNQLDIEIAMLPPLSQKSKAQWWNIVKEYVRRDSRLSDKEFQNYRRRDLNYDTESEAMTAFIKDCKRSFRSLCPAE